MQLSVGEVEKGYLLHTSYLSLEIEIALFYHDVLS